SIRGGGGIGYALGEATVLSLDLSGGTERHNLNFQPSGTGVDLPKVPDSNFITLHIGGQTEIRKHLLVTGSFLSTRGCCTSITPFLSDIQLTSNRPRDYLNLSAGWRIKPNWIVQYVYSSDFGDSLPSHTLMLRYDLGRKREK